MGPICFHYDMHQLTRRRTLQLSGAAFAGGLAGCSGNLKESSDTLFLGKLHITNHDPRPHTVHVVFLDGEKPAYWDSTRVDAADENTPGYAHFEKYPTQPGDDILHVRTGSQPKSGWERLDFSAYDGSCLSLEIGIGDESGNSPGDVTIWKTDNPQACDGMTTTTKQ